MINSKPRALRGTIIVADDAQIVGMWSAIPHHDDWDEAGVAVYSCQYAEVGYMSETYDVPVSRAWSYGGTVHAILDHPR